MIEAKLQHDRYLYALKYSNAPHNMNLHILGSVYDYYFHKQASGSWNNWTDYIDKAKSTIAPDANVIIASFCLASVADYANIFRWNSLVGDIFESIVFVYLFQTQRFSGLSFPFCRRPTIVL